MKLSTKNMCMASIFMALVFVITRFIQIPIPLGYFNVGNSVILLACTVMPSPYGILVGSIGSALADLTSYPVYTVPTLIIKAVMPFLFYKIIKVAKNKKYTLLIATAVSTLVPLLGYTIVGGIIYGNMITGLAQFPGLLVEYVANLVLFMVLEKLLSKRIKEILC